ncbi:MAG: 2-C-methyl-D-erythritol 4-phosphate cytidylyltransferase [Zoogloeaceae bacterium]|jgi:2-C-methyl-D-erythritol 4-phosphate cytidylyltransferase|nr:2-C-methyl-D-erythritol 4-phosphate cytidylyltransferase [Zoogloeaceae bacterium]
MPPEAPRPACHAIVPAAGSGARFGAETPKQYLPLMGRPLIWYCLATLCAHPAIASVRVALAPDDVHWEKPEWHGLWLSLGPRLEVLFCGGKTRAESVRNALLAAESAILPDDWVLVHDAARPCISHAALDRLLAEVGDDDAGGLLAVPLADTLKRDDGKTPPAVRDTLPRAGLWQAQTPQMFRYARLTGALAAFPDVTDEAGAVEAAGFAPRLVVGDMGNLKVTYPDDLALAEWILRGRRASED